MTPDDARAVLDAALPCEDGSPDCCAKHLASGLLSCDNCRARAAVWPIIEGLCMKLDNARIEHVRLLAKLEEAEVDKRHAVQCTHAAGDTVAALETKLAQVEAEREAPRKCDGCGDPEAPFVLYYCEPCITPNKNDHTARTKELREKLAQAEALLAKHGIKP